MFVCRRAPHETPSGDAPRAGARARAVGWVMRHHRLLDTLRRLLEFGQGKAGGPDDLA